MSSAVSTEELTMPELTDALRVFLSRHLAPGADPEIVALYRAGTGSSRENWPFDATWTESGERSTHRLLMRRDPTSAVVDTARSAEFHLLAALEATAIPAPRVHWLDDEGADLARPTMIGDRYDGKAHRGVLRDKNPLHLTAGQQLTLAQDMCDVLGRLHSLDIDELGLRQILPVPASSPAEHELERWIGELSSNELEPQPGLRLCAEWLRDHLPAAPDRLVLVHGDFRPANVLVDQGEFGVLLDWELARLGDPLDDLGWYTTPLYRGEHFIPGQWTQEEFLARYTARTGIDVSPAALTFWQILSTFRLAIIALNGVRNFCELGSDRPAAPVDALIAKVVDQVLAAEKG
ncbi:phosphotransferase family protein [Rhodococcus sp. NCIMB 12038]|uniref:phosphotransferase family protein n=1 Tax=Rhodococcus sp. NCIMB 12038 TaxID=933800 RepID=UPI00211AD02C|nr:phosphotransferase family protein [Rhodococcus sp. NCIMB 12038]